MAKTTPKVLKFDPTIAKTLGLNEAIVISQIDHYLQLSSKNDKYKTDGDGTKWTYNSLREWEVQFPFWSKDTIGRIFRRLESQGYISSRSRARRGERKWSFEYTINYDKLATLPEVKCCSIDTKTKNESNVALLIQRNGQMLQNCDKEPEITKISNTKTSFAKNLRGELTGTNRENKPALDTSLGTVTELSPNNLVTLQNCFPSLTEEQIREAWESQEGYWREKNLNNHALEGKVKAWLMKSKKQSRVSIHLSDEEIYKSNSRVAFL